MSYSLIYNKQFIKAEKEGKTVFFPMLYWGPSNCYETNFRGKREKRVRDWSLFNSTLCDKKFGTLEEMLSGVEQYRAEIIESNVAYTKTHENWDEYSDSKFGYFSSLSIGGRSTRNTTFASFKNIFVSGCENALTIEELKSYRITARIFTSDYSREELKLVGKASVDFCPQTSNELIEKVEEFEEYLKGTKVNLWISINAHETAIEKIKSSQRSPKVERENKTITVDKYFVVKDTTNDNYIIKAIRHGYKFSYSKKAGCKKFIKETIAAKYAKKMSDKMTRVFAVEEVNETAQICI